MLFSIRPVIGFLATLVVASQCFANASVTSANVTAPSANKDQSKFSGFANVSRSSSLYDFGDGTRRDGVDYMTRLTLGINSKYSVRAQGGYSQDLKYSESSDFSDTSINLQRAPRELGKSFLWGYRIGMGLPTSKDSHVRQNLLFSLSTGLNVMINPERLVNGLEIAGGVSLGRNIHQYETALDGRVNTQYSSSQTLSLSYSFSSGVSVSSEFMHRNTWSYQNVMRDQFEMSQELGYQVNPAWGLAAGHSNSGATLKPNGSDSNVQVFDDANSVTYVSTTILF